MNRRIIACAASAVMSVSTLAAYAGDTALTAFAAGEKLRFGISADAVSIGTQSVTNGTEKVTVHISLNSNPGVQSWVLLLDYDKTLVSFDSIDSPSFGGIDTYDRGGHIVINDFEANNVNDKGVIADVTFTAKAGVACGSYADCFKLEASSDKQNFFNYAGDTLGVDIETGSAALEIMNSSELAVNFAQASLDMSVGSTSKLSLNVTPANYPDKAALEDMSKWTLVSSSDAVTVSADGTLTANSLGSATITATNPAYKNDSGSPIPVTCVVNVKPGSSIISGITAFKADSDKSFKVSVFSGENKIGEGTVTSAGGSVVSGLTDGSYTVLIECSDTAYAPKKTNITVNGSDVQMNDILYLYGDANLDGQLGGADISIIQKILCKWNITLPYDEIANVDGSEDGSISGTDISRYLKYLTKWDVTLGKR